MTLASLSWRVWNFAGSLEPPSWSSVRSSRFAFISILQLWSRRRADGNQRNNCCECSSHGCYFITPVLFLKKPPSLFTWKAAYIHQHNKHTTRRVAVYLKIHCNIRSKRASPTGVLDRWQLFTYLLTHNLFSSCIRRCQVSRDYDWVMLALCAGVTYFQFLIQSNSVCFVQYIAS